MKKKLIIAIFVILTALGIGVLPVHADPFGDLSERPILLAAAQSHQGKGTVKVIDSEKNRIKLAHGPIKSIGWGAMKMFFEVEETDLLEDLKVGDKINFEFLKTRDGRFVIIDIEKIE